MCVRDVIVDCANVHECVHVAAQVRASARCVTVLGVKSRHYRVNNRQRSTLERTPSTGARQHDTSIGPDASS